MDQNQYYPTPYKLGRKAWGLFKNRDFSRILEPSAGKGDLAKLRPNHKPNSSYTHTPPVDCIEVNLEHHPALRSEGFQVVGVDFLAYEGPGSLYSHIIMNPPFAKGAEHVLKAWDLLYDGEIVAILNAETIKNPFSKERRLLVGLVEQHGSVEYVENAFSIPDAERKTNVEVALVHLQKKSRFNDELVGSIMDGLKTDSTTSEDLAAGVEGMNELALPSYFVDNAVLAFKAAVEASREAAITSARSRYYANLLGETMAQRTGETVYSDEDASLEGVRKEILKKYEELKDRAWAGILHSTQVTAKLSSEAIRRLESDFETIKSLEFTPSNIYGFLCGLAANQSQIQIEMACDVFDMITRYHSENTVYYKGWKSNDKHRTCGMRIKTSRFIIPGNHIFTTRLSWENLRRLQDFDKVFAMLDGKTEPAVSLHWVFEKRFTELCRGERVSASYFDVRYYPGAGTIHYFAREKKLVERLNLLVGRHRRWLPPEDVRVSKEFWLQYEKAEKLDKEIREEARPKDNRWWNSPLDNVRSGDTERREMANAALDDAINIVLRRHGIDPDAVLEPPRMTERLLEAS